VKSIYNENLVPIDEDFQKIENVFSASARACLESAQERGLNLREVSHELGGLLRLIESEMILTAAAKRLDEQENTP
jgi:hypothetical protein